MSEEANLDDYSVVPLPDTSAVRVGVVALQCNICGALVGDREMHDDFHEVVFPRD